MGSRNAGFVAAVSDFALIVPLAIEGSFAQFGIRPHFISEICRIGSLGCWRITGTCCVGAILYLGDHSSSHGAVSKYSSMICFRRESLYLPHIEEHYARSHDLRNLVATESILEKTAIKW